MGAASTTLNILGLVFLSHAVYSAYEHSLLPSSKSSASPAASSGSLLSSFNPNVTAPLDVTLETLFSVLLLCIGTVWSSPALKPIKWNVWAGELEKQKGKRLITAVGVGGGNPFAKIEERDGFLDIRKSREEFAQWERSREKQ